MDEVGPQLIELGLPESERDFFGGRDKVLVAFNVPALDLSPEAEMAVVGSPFLEQLLVAVRTRGVRLSAGLVPGELRGESPPLGVAVKDGTVGTPKRKRARHAVGRLLARVVIRAGAAVEEHLLQSRFVDLVTGEPLPDAAASACAAVEEGSVDPASGRVPDAKRAKARPWGELVPRLVADLEAQMAPRLEKLRAEAARSLALELERIDSYYHRMLEDASARGPSSVDDDAFADAARAIETEHARRRVEEERRHQVRSVVHPLQVVEMEVVVEHARWTLTRAEGVRATLATFRYVAGAGTPRWRMRCPSCDRDPTTLVVSDEGTISCAACTDTGDHQAMP